MSNEILKRLIIYNIHREKIITRKDLIRILDDTDLSSFSQAEELIFYLEAKHSQAQEQNNSGYKFNIARQRILELSKRHLELCITMNINVLLYTDEQYPSMLREASDKPVIIFYKGKIDFTQSQNIRQLAVIGTRKMTSYAERFINRELSALSAYNMNIISGLARGVDSLAHQVALDNSMLTTACLAHGIDITYPAEHKSLQDRIAENGLLISEHAPGVKPIKQYFPARNRIISALSEAVLVVEAGLKSGTLITTEFAANQGRDVLAVPGSIYAESSSGCNNLIRDGAIMIRNVHDLLEYFDFSYTSTRLDTSDNILELSNNSLSFNSNKEDLKDIIYALQDGALSESELTRKLNIENSILRSNLVVLESLKLIIIKRGMISLTK